MKRIGNLFDRISSLDNLKVADAKAQKGKHSRYLIQMIEEVPKGGFPFKTIIVKENENYEFT